jgi:predicted regulator of Ras-like GTPase activity (Roadblock/LC7/MglB family)
MFLDQLSRVSNRIEGALALSLVARDGIPVESFSADPDLDLEALAAELINQVRSITENHRELGVGEVQQLAVMTDRLTLMVSSVAADYYLLLVPVRAPAGASAPGGGALVRHRSPSASATSPQPLS